MALADFFDFLAAFWAAGRDLAFAAAFLDVFLAAFFCCFSH